MNIHYHENDRVTLEELLELYASVEWSNYTNQPEIIYDAYQNSLYYISAYSEEELVGIIRVVGDGHSIIYIQDLIVRPDFQRQGIGSALVERILGKYQDVYQKVLLTDNEVRTQTFYESLGFVEVHHINLNSYFYLPNR